MDIARNNVCKALDIVANSPLNAPININEISFLSDPEKKIVFLFLSFYGVVKNENGYFQLSSESAQLFIKSLSEFLRKENILIPVWDNRSYSNDEINKSNVFVSSNYLALFEQQRKKIM